MIQKYRSFMGNYEAVLYAKKEHPVFENKLDTLKNAAISVAIFSSVFIIIGFALNIIENLNYVFLSLNTIVVGSFILYLYRREIRYKDKAKLEYDHHIFIAHQVISLLAILFLSNSLFFLLFLRDVLNIINLIVYGVLAIVFSILHYSNERQVMFLSHYPRAKVASSSLLLFVMYVSFFSLLPIANITLNYFLTSIIIIVLYFIKKVFLSNGIFPRVMKPIFITCLSLTTFVFIFTSIIAKVTSIDDSPLNLKLIKNVISVDQSYELDSEIAYVWKLIQADDRLYLICSGVIEVYSKSMEYLDSIEMPSNARYFIGLNGRLGYITDEIMYSHYSEFYLYYEGEGFRFEQLIEGYSSDCIVFEYEGNLSCAYSNAVFSTIITGSDLIDVDSYTWVNLPNTLLPEYSLYFISDDLLVYGSEYSLKAVGSEGKRNKLYNSNRVLAFEDSEYRMYTSDEFLKEVRMPLFTVPIEYGDTLVFFFDDEYYRIITIDADSKRILYTLDLEGNIINIADVGSNSIFFAEHLVISYNWRENQINELDFDAPGKYIVDKDSYIYPDLFFVLMLVSIVAYHLYSKDTQ